MNHLLATIIAVSFVLAGCEAFEERPHETTGFLVGTAAGAVIGYDIGGGIGALPAALRLALGFTVLALLPNSAFFASSPGRQDLAVCDAGVM